MISTSQEIPLCPPFSKGDAADAELHEKATTKDFLAVQAEGKRQVSRTIKHYNLDAIISVGYRVNSKRGVRFRPWTVKAKFIDTD